MVYSIQFTYQDDSDETQELAKAKAFFDDLVEKSQLQNVRILKNRKSPRSYLAIAAFESDKQFERSMKRVGEIGIHNGLHGAMIENVSEFSVGFHDDL